jgi:hypothetical protein
MLPDLNQIFNFLIEIRCAESRLVYFNAMKNHNTYGRRIKGVSTFASFSCRLSWLEFIIVREEPYHFFELHDCYGNILLTGINMGSASDTLRDIQKLKKAIHIPARIQTEIFPEEGRYFTINDKRGYPLASSHLLFSRHEYNTMMYWLKIQLATTPVVFEIEVRPPRCHWVLNEE